MKITIYELLGLVKDGKAPERILYNNYIWSWTGDDYQTILRDEKEQFLITGMYYTWLTEFLNDEVEILEKKKIPEKLDWCEENTFMEQKETTYLSPKERRLLDSNFKELGNKINSIIDYLNSKGE